jgi:hypothetical protein
MKRELIFGIFFTILTLSLISLASAYTCQAGSHTLEGGTLADGPEWCIPDVGAVACTAGCSCDGVHYFDCACDADFCDLCQPGEIGYEKECHHKAETGNTPGSTPSGNAEGTDSPQAPSGILELVGNGVSTLVLTAFGQPSTVGGKAQPAPPTATEMILSIIALVALLTSAVAIAGAILKPIFAKILASRAGGAPVIMAKAQPSTRNPNLGSPTGESSWGHRVREGYESGNKCNPRIVHNAKWKNRRQSRTGARSRVRH